MYKITNKTTGEEMTVSMSTSDMAYSEFTLENGTVVRFEKPTDLVDESHFENAEYKAEFVVETPAEHQEAVDNLEAEMNVNIGSDVTPTV